MTKTELKLEIAKRTGSTRQEVGKFLEAFIEVVKEGLRKGEKIKIANLGQFSVISRKERVGQNPKTGEKVIIPAKKTPKFIPAKSLKEVVG